MDNAQLGNPEDTMDEDQVVDYRAATISAWKETESYTIIRRLIVGRLIEQNDMLLDRKTPDDKLPVIREGICILNEVLGLFAKPEADKQMKDELIAVARRAEEEASLRENQVALEAAPRYYGG